MMNSSTGFKKRSLLRPPSSHLQQTVQKQYLKVMDITQSQFLLTSNLRTQIAGIQNEINQLDKDKKIRMGEVSLEKGYVLGLKKWLREVQQMGEKEEDEDKILKAMGSDGYEAGFKKLWKLICQLDQMITKTTELQIVHFLKYDDGFGEFASDSPNAVRILQAISKGGFNPSTFYPSQLIVERYQELFGCASEMKRKGHSTSRSQPRQSLDDTNDLIEQLQSQNRKLTKLLSQLEKEKTKTPPPPPQNQKPKSADQLFQQLDQKYKEQIANLNSELSATNKKMLEHKLQVESMEIKLNVAQQQLSSSEFKEAKKPKSGTYEQALLQELTKMKKGFERRIQLLMGQFSTKQKQSKKQYFEIKTENDKLKWQKGLLLKKFDTLSK